MKFSRAFLLAVLLPALLFGQGGGKQVLFLGNSYTYANNLPQLVIDLAQAAGDTLVVGVNAPGGYTFQLHAANQTTLAMIQQGNWDFVVLQEQSQLPSFPLNQVQAQCFPYARALDSLAKMYNSCAESMFFMTWGRENGDAQNCASWPPVCTYAGMDSLLRLRYQMMANDNQAVVCPVGAVWRYLRAQHPAIELYATDESHPSEAGSYAAACAFYTAIFRKDPSAIPFNFTLNPIEAGAIRLAAKLVVLDSLAYWNIGKFDPLAGFTHSLSAGLQVSFTNLSLHANHYLWDFGDGTTATALNPQHAYTAAGTYPVSLRASWCNRFDTTSQSIAVVQTGLAPTETWPAERLCYPNPAGERIFLSPRCLRKTEVFLLQDVLGRCLIQGQTTDIQDDGISLEAFPPGLYFLSLWESGTVVFRDTFFKQ